jgi:hypothetical protein
MIVEAGNVYYAKINFTSGASFDANDWYLQKASNLADGFQRAYMFYIRYDKDTQVHSFGIAQSADYTDPSTGAPLANQLVFPFAEVNEPAFVDSNRTRLGFVVIRNQTGADFVPGTTTLVTANVFVHVIGAFDNVSV